MTRDVNAHPGRRLVALAVLAMLPVAAACGGAAGVAASSSADGGAASTSASTASGDPGGASASAHPAAPTGTAPTGVDALELTGPVDVADVGDMQPVISGASPRLPATVVDSQGTSITVTRADRVIALDLYGTLTDTVIGLGLADRLVGRGVSDTQARLKDLPVVSLGGIGLNVEALLSLHPDVVLTTMTIGSAPLYDQIEAAGVTVVRFPQAPSIDDIPHAIHQVGAAFGMGAEADQLAAHTEQRLAEVREDIAALAAATARQPRAIVLYIRGNAGISFILGADYGSTDLLRELKLADVAAEAGIDGLTPANAEALIRLNPEIVLTMRAATRSAGGVAGLLQRPGLSATVAGERERILTAADSQLLSFGPRTPDNLLAVARALYTDGT